MSSLVIVESPAKAKTIGRFLGPEYVVEASYGHVRDLPEKADQIPPQVKKEKWARLGVNIEKDFEPLYVVPEDKKKHVARLKKALKHADRLLLATDEDREGESICWHLVQVLEPEQPILRIAFHEITKGAILQALENPRAIDDHLVRAQEGRRILDRLFGYLLSPVLWKKVRRGLSAGRVQSVAVRLCVLRELERRAFARATYCGVEAEFTTEHGSFNAKLARLGERRVATGSDFDETTGLLPASSNAIWLRTPADAEKLIASLARPFTVRRVDERPQLQGPPPPFTTATLQQEANRKLGFSARHTMRLAQRLYEGVDVGGDRLGLITYMRTDSVTLAESALADAARVIGEMYGATYSAGPRRYRTQSAGAQEAHEAIRPTEIGRTAQSLEPYLDRDELRLYEMIWKRTVASQMADARLQRTTVELVAEAAAADGPAEAVFTASGKRIEFPGFLRAYVEGSDDPAAEIADREVILPPLAVGQPLDPVRLQAPLHETTPPARYTEATLVKKLEAEGIGRPSTYAAIIDTIQERGYIQKQGKTLTPTFTAIAVTQLLDKHFTEYVDVKFTARMEQQLDEIAAGQLD
ncbi:MAG: type I DNA topoisomerase, partial [Deltaproteobacteria bacterium]|nr:type I DNA topoisomerase [Deltaproteobacteria bacterium]